MYQKIFRNWKAAALFVVLTIVGAVQLVGNKDNSDNLRKMTADLAEQRQKMEAAAAQDDETVSDIAEEEEDDSTFTADQELFDSADGYDPTPSDDNLDSSDDSEPAVLDDNPGGD